MKKLFCLLLLVVVNAQAAFNEFYCINTAGACGSNVFSGSTSSTTPAYSSFSGNWNSTDTFTPTDGSTPASSVSVGDWASVYPDGEVVTKYIARVVTVNAGVNGTIVLSTTAIAGTAPGTLTGTATIRVGGAWHGPGTRDQVGGQGGSTNYFPFDFVTGTLTNTSLQFPRVNFKSGTTYTITNGITHSKAGPVKFEGYSTNPGDGGKAVVDGGTSGAYYVLIILSANDCTFQDLVFSNNGGSSSAANGFSVTGARNSLFRCVVHDISNNGIVIVGLGGTVGECEVYNCNKSNTAGSGGINNAGSQTLYYRCTVHDNTGGNSSGFQFASSGIVINCISESNGKSGIGFSSSATGSSYFSGSDFYNNAASGVDLAQTAVQLVVFENCNFVKNGAYGISCLGSILRNGYILNCGFGSGTQTNVSGSLSSGIQGLSEIGSILYPADALPWQDAPNGDFRITLTQAKSTGIGTFTQTAASYSGTIAYPDIGAGQGADTNSAASGGSYTFAQ